jgi:excisionase family DNA binding protein
MNNKDTKYYTVKQVSNLLQLHNQSVLKFINDGRLEALKLHRTYRISVNSLADFIKSCSTRKPRP